MLSVPLVLLAVLPPAKFLMFAWRPVSRAVPTAGTACFLAVVVLALARWLVPLSSDLLNDVIRRSLGAAIGSDYPPPLSHSEGLAGRDGLGVPRRRHGDLCGDSGTALALSVHSVPRRLHDLRSS